MSFFCFTTLTFIYRYLLKMDPYTGNKQYYSNWLAFFLSIFKYKKVLNIAL